MTSPDSPAGARRRVRLALREARSAKGLTQGQVAEAMEWSMSKVIRIESGEVTISPNDLRPLLSYLDITDKATADKLLQDARTARRRQMWWDEPSLREHLTPASRQLIQYEMEAVELRHFTNIMIPGRLQTNAYAEAILRGHREDLGDTDVAARLASRLRRRDELLARRDFPKTYLLIDESVLYRRVGSAQITSDQLTDLLRLNRTKPMSIRLLPWEADPPLPLIGPFDLLSLPGEVTNVVLYRESHLQDEVVDDPKNVARHRAIFDQYWDVALDETTTAFMIEESSKKLAESGPESRMTPTISPPTPQKGARVAKTAKAAGNASRPRRGAAP